MIKKIIIIFLLLIFINIVSGVGINPNNIQEDDYYTYKYFNNVTDKFCNIFEDMTFDNEGYVNKSKLLYKDLGILKNETLIAKTYNISSPVIYYIDPFYECSKILYKIAIANNEFRKSKKFEQYVVIISNIENFKENLKYINNIELKEGNKTLKFNTSKLLDIINMYENTIKREISPTDKLMVYISKEKPIIFENVEIYGSGKNGKAYLYINNKKYNITIKNNIFSINYTFKESGYYTIYVTQDNKTSNILNIEVIEIPTYITTKNTYYGYVYENLTIDGVVIDYFGNYLNGTIYINNKSVHLDNGRFVYSIYSEFPKNITIILKYNGDLYHSPSKKIVHCIFEKKPIDIFIDSKVKKVETNKPLEIFGKVSIDEPINLTILINNKTYKEIKNVKNNFSINLSFNNPGEYNISVYFPGNEKYKKSYSNVLTIDVSKNSYIPYIILIMLSIGTITYYILQNKQIIKIIHKTNTSNLNKNYNYSDIYLTDNISELYNDLYNILTEKYNLPKSLTPRELLSKIKELNNNKIYEDLKYITKIHELYTYKKIKLYKDVLKEFLTKVKKILNEIL